MQANIHTFFDPVSQTFSYLLVDLASKQAVVIDPVLDFELNRAKFAYEQADRIVAYCQQHALSLRWILETHIHADHLSAATYLQQRLGGEIAVSRHINRVHQHFSAVYNIPLEQLQQQHFNQLLTDQQRLHFGNSYIDVIEVPGHTPADVAFYLNQQALFVGDTLFAPDVGSARCDFPGGNAGQLYDSIQRIYSFPEQTQLYLCHDYPPATRSHQCCWSLQAQRQQNIHVHHGISRADFIRTRETRDASLPLPKLLLQSIQANIRAGQLPKPEANGIQYLKIPLNLF